MKRWKSLTAALCAAVLFLIKTDQPRSAEVAERVLHPIAAMFLRLIDKILQRFVMHPFPVEIH